MTYQITLNYDDSDQEFYAVACGIVSRCCEEMKYRVEEENPEAVAKLETMEFEYYQEADIFEFWFDCAEVSPETMSKTELKNTIIENLETASLMSFQEEIDLIRSL